jgi:hypothetical protein
VTLREPLSKSHLERPDEGGLARRVGPEEAEGAAARDFEVDAKTFGPDGTGLVFDER